MCPGLLSVTRLLSMLCTPCPQDAVLECMLDQGLDSRHVLEGLRYTDEQQECVLALRGLLAYGVLEHCLQMRVHVDYGINR